MDSESTQRSPIVAVRLILSGRVQGLGIRPSLFRLATSCGLAGHMGNSVRGVEVELEGEAFAIQSFLDHLKESLPTGAHLEGVAREELPVLGRSGFTIRRDRFDGPIAARIPPDLRVCVECGQEVQDPSSRRYRYPFTSCTLCGPRYSLLMAMPYEREDTTMSRFAFCAACAREYQDPTNRRFHAQTQACPVCGPRLWLEVAPPVNPPVERTRVGSSVRPDPAERDGGTATPGTRLGAECGPQRKPNTPQSQSPESPLTVRLETVHGSACLSGDPAIRAAVQLLLAGKVLAVRGVGGYQLLVDATNAAAVQRLRDRKKRRHKPLAVLVRSTAVARELAHFEDVEQRVLESPSNPIVLLRKSDVAAARLAVDVTGPGIDNLGLMLPTTPLHELLAEGVGRPLVCTSGNREGDPLEYQTADATRRLAGVADAWLHHDREIAHPIDDSVVRVMAGRPVTIRLARGLAPLSLELPWAPSPAMLAVGGHLKGAAAWTNGRQSVLGPHVGDLDSPDVRQRYLEQLRAWQRLYGFTPAAFVHDLHPGYFTTEWSRGQTGTLWGAQHHHAHVVSGMLEHGWLDRDVLGVSWDGTGAGTDGAIWGGEFLLARVGEYRRLGHLRPFPLPGGEAAIHEIWRTSLALLDQVIGRNRLAVERPVGRLSPRQTSDVLRILDHPRFSPITTSVGRLFDGVACLVLGLERANFEGEAAMRLEFVADPNEGGAYCLNWDGDGGELDWRPLVAEVWADLARDVSPGVISARFHRGLARGLVAVVRTYPDSPVVLSGGVFQNRRLVELVVEEWGNHHQPLGLPGLIPPNDGGLAAGQLAIGLGMERQMRRS